ncbi:MAG: hypothetical protein NZ890_18860 [Myxococcota bacterium]|nr:hypothetical protein [Myxococcota bacterium]
MRAPPLLLALLASCSLSSLDDESPPSGQDRTEGTIRLEAEPITLQPGQEVTRCITARLPTHAPVDVVRIQARQSGTHHVVFYREEQDVPPSPTRDCRPLDILGEGVRIERVPLFIGETPEAELTMPPGVAYRLRPGAAYTIEGHYMNATPAPLTTSAVILLHTAPAGAQVVEADMLFYASVSALNKVYDGRQRGLPPGVTTTISPPGFRAPREGIKLFALTSHQHRTGIDFVISKSRGRDDPGQLLYRNQDWAHPPLLRFPDEALITFDSSKGEGLRWECTYHNTNDFYLTFGQSAVRNEMCILWGYYFPGRGFDLHFE